MSETKLKRTVADPKAYVRVKHTISAPRDDQQCQPMFEDNYKRLSYLMGRQDITHEQACKIYLEATEREITAKTVREFWGAVLQNWNELTEPI